MQTKKCIHCGTIIEKKVNCCKKEWENKKYCNRKCLANFKRGKTVYNSGQFRKGCISNMKGKHHSNTTKQKLSDKLKGRPANSGSFKKGQISNEKHPNWVGDKVGVKALHIWVRRHKIKPTKCEYCGRDDKPLELSNIDHKYCRNINDFVYICRSCHRLYDIKYNRYKTRGVDTSKI